MSSNKIFLFLFLAHAGLACADTTHVDLQLSASHDDNVSRGARSADIKGDNVLDLELKATRTFMLTPNSGVQLEGGIDLAQYMHYEDLSHATAEVGSTYRIQPVAGYTAPWLELGVNFEKLKYRDSDIRDGTLVDTHAAFGKRFTDRIRARVGAGWDQRRAEEDSVFDLRHRRLFVAADYKLSQTATLYGNWSRVFGDQVFAAPDGKITTAVAEAPDPVFGARNAYRLGAIANIYAVGASMAVNAGNTLDLGLQRYVIDADTGKTYDGLELRVSWLYRFR